LIKKIFSTSIAVCGALLALLFVVRFVCGGGSHGLSLLVLLLPTCCRGGLAFVVQLVFVSGYHRFKR
jgi:hypothetical protein